MGTKQRGMFNMTLSLHKALEQEANCFATELGGDQERLWLLSYERGPYLECLNSTDSSVAISIDEAHIRRQVSHLMFTQVNIIPNWLSGLGFDYAYGYLLAEAKSFNRSL